MGHYASEMEGPTRYNSEYMEQRRKKAREQAGFLWDLAKQREEQGVLVSAIEQLVCPRCFALAQAILREDHDGWHRDEEFRMSPGLIG